VTRPEQPSTGPRRSLTRADVVAAAIRLLDEGGIEALSMRRLATALGTGASTLYWHVRDKDQLLALILDETIAAVSSPSDGTWRERLTALLEAARLALVARPALVPVVLGARWDIGHHALRVADSALGLLAESKIPQENIADAYFLLLHYTMGAVEAEAHARWNSTYAQEARRQQASTVDGTDLDEYQNLLSHGPETTPANMAERFRFGVDTILDGLTGPSAVGLESP